MQDKNKNQVDEILRRNRSVGVGERLKEAYDRSNKEFQDDSAATKQELIRYKDRAVKNISWLAGALQRKGSSLKQFFTKIMQHLGQKARKLNPRVPIDKAVRFMKKRNNPYIDSFNRNPPSQS
jgi:UDP-N-acetylmuramoylalanine-D-glutamate ligase